MATGRQVKRLESNEERGQKEELPQIFVLFVFLFVCVVLCLSSGPMPHVLNPILSF